MDVRVSVMCWSVLVLSVMVCVLCCGFWCWCDVCLKMFIVLIVCIYLC